MSGYIYNVVFSGQLVEGISAESAKQQLALLYKKDLAWAEKLFGGQPVTIKSTGDLKEAMKYARALKMCGAETEITRHPAPAKPKPQPQTQPKQPKKQERSKADQINSAFLGQIEAHKPALSYRMGIALVAFCMVLLPLLYLASAAAVGYGTYRFAVSLEVIQTLRHGSLLGIAAYFGVICGGIATILFMLKPVFARFGGEPSRHALSPLQQRPIFELVEQIADKVGAPMPAEIVIDNQLNASASLIDGALRNRELRLTIGLPLVTVTSANQLAGIIAHELGHFSQSAGMGLTTLISRINLWFYLSATGQDPWDYKLSQWQKQAEAEDLFESEGANGLADIFFTIIKACLWLSRKIIAIFWKAGELVSSSTSREMEFDADRYEARLVGSSIFRETFLKLAESSVAYRRAVDAFNYVLGSDNQLVDDFPMLTELSLQQLSDEERAAIHQGALERKTGLFDSHPATQERIAHAEAEKSKGIFHLDHDSRWLFEDFEALSKKHTLWHYRNVMEMRVEQSQLIDARTLFEKDQQTTEEWNMMREHPLAQLPHFFPIPLPERHALHSDSRLDGVIPQDREAIRQLESTAKLASKQFEKAQERQFNLKYAMFLADVGIPFDARTYRLKDTEPGTIHLALDKSERLLGEAREDMNRFARAHANDFLHTLQLLRTKGGSNEQADELAALLETLAILEARKSELNTLWDNRQLIASLGELLDEETHQASLRQRIDRLFQESGKQLQRFHQLLGRETTPFDHGGKAKRSLADHLFSDNPSFGHENDIWAHMDNMPHNFFALRGRVLGRILQISSEAMATT